jgi:hypothetical protein
MMMVMMVMMMIMIAPVRSESSAMTTRPSWGSWDVEMSGEVKHQDRDETAIDNRYFPSAPTLPVPYQGPHSLASLGRCTSARF